MHIYVWVLYINFFTYGLSGRMFYYDNDHKTFFRRSYILIKIFKKKLIYKNNNIKTCLLYNKTYR